MSLNLSPAPLSDDSAYPPHYTERSLLLLGYDMHKPHNYLLIAGDELPGDDPHLLDRYNRNQTTLCGQVVSRFDVEPQGGAFCPDCYNILLNRTGLSI